MNLDTWKKMQQFLNGWLQACFAVLQQQLLEGEQCHTVCTDVSAKELDKDHWGHNAAPRGEEHPGFAMLIMSVHVMQL